MKTNLTTDSPETAIPVQQAKRPLYEVLASRVQARLNCEQSNNDEWHWKHEQAIETLVKDNMPSGSGIDNGTDIDLSRSTGNKLVFTTSYHHMNDGGYYDGWTEHTVTVTPSLQFGFDLTIGGRDRNGIKEYLGDVFRSALSELV